MSTHSTFRRAERRDYFAGRYKRVEGEGPVPARIMLIGERPGKNEALRGRPFVGKAGEILNTCLVAANLRREEIYVTNLVKTYDEYRKPTREEIADGLVELQRELEEVSPAIVGLMGTFAVESMLAVERAELGRRHGVPVAWQGRIALPMFHPSGGQYSAADMNMILDDFLRLGAIADGEITVREDEYAGKEEYEEWQGEFYTQTTAAVDTEGSRRKPWCLTLSQHPGRAYLVRPGQRGAFGSRVLLHNSLHDLGVLRSLGIEVREDQFCDTMLLAYHLCVEPQGLKDLAYRHQGMGMVSYRELIAEPSKQHALTFLREIASREWPDPEPYTVLENGVYRTKKFLNVSKYATRAIKDLESGKLDKNGDPPDLRKRWNSWDEAVREPVIEVLGDMPEATLDDVDPETAKWYACRDADATLRIAPLLEQKISDMGLQEAVRVDHAVIPIVDRMQEVGIKLAPTEFWQDIQRKCERQMGQSKYKVYKMTGAEINPASSQQCAELLYDQMGLTPPMMTDSGEQGSTSALALEGLLGQAPVVEPIIEYREAQKIDGTYRRPLQKLCQVGDGRARSTFRLTRTTTGRLSLADPPLHQIPIMTDLGKEIRGGFVAEEGCVLGDWDLNQIEMRLMAHESRDRTLCGMFDSGEDIHTQTACTIFGVSESQLSVNPKNGKVNDYRRSAAKRTGFGIINGITPIGIQNQMILNRSTKADGTHWTEQDCEDMHREWFKMYPGVWQFQQACIAEAQATGLTRESISGRIMYLASIWSPNKVLADTAARNSYVMHTQGGAAALLKRAMATIWTYLKQLWLDYPDYRVEPVLQVHDELLFELTDDPWWKDLVSGLVIDALSNSTKLRVGVEADGNFGNSWLEAH